jgi:hypothetical protein
LRSSLFNSCSSGRCSTVSFIKPTNRSFSEFDSSTDRTSRDIGLCQWARNKSWIITTLPVVPEKPAIKIAMLRNRGLLRFARKRVVLCELLPCCVPTLRHSSCNGHSEEPSHDSHLLNTLKVISQFHQHGGRTVVPLVRTGVQMRGLLLFPCSEFYSHHKQKGEWRYENRLTLKTTPAMSAGVPNRRWEIQDLLACLAVNTLENLKNKH